MAEPKHEKLALALAARHELGPGYDRELIDGLVEQMDAEIERRVSEHLGKWGVAGVRSHRDTRVTVALGSLGLAIPLSAIGLFEGLAGMILVWVGIVGVNLAFMLGHGHER